LSPTENGALAPDDDGAFSAGAAFDFDAVDFDAIDFDADGFAPAAFFFVVVRDDLAVLFFSATDHPGDV
jgi:hypothetical protein